LVAGALVATLDDVALGSTLGFAANLSDLRAPGPAFHAGFVGDSVVAFAFPLPFGSGLGVFGFGLGVLSFGLELLSFFGLGLLPPWEPDFPSPFGLGLLEGDLPLLGLLSPFEPELLELELLGDLEGDFPFRFRWPSARTP